MMSVYETQFENETQNSLQKNQSTKNSSECTLSSSKTSEIERAQENTRKIRKENFSAQFSTTSTSSSQRQPEGKNLPEITKWRRAVVEDKGDIKQLQVLTGDIANSLYRRKSIDELIEISYFSVVQFDSEDNLVSFTAYDSYPNIPSVPFLWKDWLTTNYKVYDINAGNVLFVHYMVWEPRHEDRFLQLLLETLFVEFVGLKHVIIVKPPKADVPKFYLNYFMPIFPPGMEELEYGSVQLLLLCLRSSVIQPLYIRLAFEHEFDIIRSIINSNVKKTNGKNPPYVWDFVNFFYQKDKKSLICEFDKQMAGIMILNLKTDLDLLNEWFELAPFNGLRKKDFSEKESLDCETVSVPEKSYSKVQKDANLLISSEFLFSQMNWEMMISKIKPTDSFITQQSSCSSSSDDSQFSQFSFFRLSPRIDLKKSETSEVTYGKSEISKIGGDINVVIRASGSTMTHFFPPKYHGHSNAFVIDFFAIDCSKIDEKLSSFAFLEAAFKVVPDREYCVLIIPTDLLPFPLMDLFVRVTPRPVSSSKHELYLCHKNSLSAMAMSVRKTKKDDLTLVNQFLKNVDEGDAVYHDILNDCFEEHKHFRSFILTVEDRIVGVSLINSQDCTESFRVYFEVDDFAPTEQYKNENHSVIKHLVVSPMYHNHARFFVREIMRLLDNSCLYYVYSKPRKRRCNLLTVLGEFFPVKPRKKVEVSDPEVRLPFSEKKRPEDCYGLYFLNPRLCGFHKIHNNVVIVVVGASGTAVSFLESLIFGPESYFYNYNNLICVTPHGLEAESVNEDLKNFMFPVTDNFSRKYVSMLSLETYVNFIYGIMTEINRSEKYIVVNNKTSIRYDYLILTCGLQYLSPTPKTKEVFKRLCKNNFRGSLARFLFRTPEQKKIYVPKHPNNMFIINTSSDAQNAIRALQFLMHRIKNVQQDKKKIIVYGHDLMVFLTIHTLLKLGIPGEFIAFVEPFPSESTTVTLFNDYSVDEAVIESVKECKVNYYTNYFMYDWSLSSEDYITTITFHSSRQQLVIPCLAFFPFLEKLVSDVNFNACISAGLVYDGKLIINRNFRTNDSYIYAAGPFTKYARRYFANEYNHQYYSSREVGQKLAEIIREKIDPDGKGETKEEDSDLVPQLKAPVFLYCQLPGDFNLFVLKKPGKELDLETAYNFYDYGEVLTTGNCQMKDGFGYFRLHLNPEGFVESITCYTKNKIDYLNLCSLYGLHERILNNLVLRYDMAMIPDFFEYFRQPWTLALFHDNFQQLRECNSKAFYKKTSNDETFGDRVVEKLKSNKWKSLPKSIKHHLELEYLNSTVHEEIKNNLLQFLEYYKEDLPVYATPNKVKYFFNERSES